MSQPPQPPYSGQPYPGEPEYGPPSSGPPQQGQPHHGRPDQNQPWHGQPDPDAPTSVPPSYPPTTAFPAADPYANPGPYGQQPPYGDPGQYGQQPPYGSPDQYGQQSPYGKPGQYGQQSPYGDPGQYGQQPPYGSPGQYGQQPPYGSPGQYGQQSPYGDPGQYGQPPPYDETGQYGQPAAYGQPEYGQTEYGQPAYGLPPAPPPKKRSKVLPIVLISVAIALVLCVGGAVALYAIGKDKVDEINAAANPSAGSTKTAKPTSEATKAPATIRIVEPKTLGGRPKLTDAQFASAAAELEKSLKKVPGATKSVGALYGTVSKRNIVMVAAAQAPIDHPKRELDAVFAGAGVDGVKISNIGSVPTGSLGGSAKCGKAVADDVTMAICSWADAGSLGMFIWYFKSVSTAKAEFPKLRAEVEKRS